MLRVWNQAKEAAQSGPPISINFSKESDVQLHWP
jgi:hypothetical protein